MLARMRSRSSGWCIESAITANWTIEGLRRRLIDYLYNSSIWIPNLEVGGPLMDVMLRMVLVRHFELCKSELLVQDCRRLIMTLSVIIDARFPMRIDVILW